MKTISGFVALSVAVFACSETKESPAPTPASEPEDITAPRTDWDTQKLTRVHDVVDGIEFSVELPGDLDRDERKADGDIPGYVTWNATNFLTNPGFTAQVAGMPPANVEAAAARAEMHPEPATVTRKDNVRGGFIVTMHETSKQFLSVEIWRKSEATGKLVRFGISVRHSKPIARFDAMVAWMEKVALTFQPK